MGWPHGMADGLKGARAGWLIFNRVLTDWNVVCMCESVFTGTVGAIHVGTFNYRHPHSLRPWASRIGIHHIPRYLTTGRIDKMGKSARFGCSEIRRVQHHVESRGSCQ